MYIGTPELCPVQATTLWQHEKLVDPGADATLATEPLKAKRMHEMMKQRASDLSAGD